MVVKKNDDDINNDKYLIRPAGRHILTIGRDLIQDKYAAIVELVKNAYDADSPDVSISFKSSAERKDYSIVIKDNGHGMSRDTVLNQWMVPSTDDKLKRKRSPGGRIMQGRKGVGRYAASILGDDLLLETVADRRKTTVYLEWDVFEKAQYLDDVEVLVESKKTRKANGTTLTITGGKEHLEEWDKEQFDKLRFELKKIISPVSNVLSGDKSKDAFRIHLKLEDFLDVQEDAFDEDVKPYPIFDLFDYRISGKIAKNGKGILNYSLQKARNTTQETIPFDFEKPTECGELLFDIRVYDREKEAIELLIRRGLKDESGKYVGKLQARQLLNEYNGIGVYRNGFRIRPLGDAEFDWLKLNERRIQNPSMRVGSNQVIGYVEIQSEEQSDLIEKSARDGLRENTAFEKLKAIAQKVITELESRRFSYRKKTGLSRPALKLEKELTRLFAFDDLKDGIRSRLKKGKVDQNTAEEIISILTKEEETKNRIAEDIRQAVAVYQGQATLGKIINVILHEGRKPLNYFKNQIPNLNHWVNGFVEDPQKETLNRILPITKGIGNNADIFVKLFSRLDPLAAAKRGKKRAFNLQATIQDTFDVFTGELKQIGIEVSFSGADDYIFTGWPQDIYTVFTNLIDNSIYLINEKKSTIKRIAISITTEEHELQYIDYHDTGPGIESQLIASEVIFEPEFSTKPNGTGLGLAIAGEAAARNGLELKAFEHKNGAHFRLQLKSGS
jgi:signal transduction histidine kinase